MALELTYSEDMSPFAQTIVAQKYAKTKNGVTEDWNGIAERVVRTVYAAVDAPADLVERTLAFVKARKIMPGGRYLSQTGMPYHQTQNCALFRADDSREGWADLLHKITLALSTGAGVGVDYSDVRPKGSPIRKTGGTASGPVSLMQMVNEAGRHIMAGGSRRSAIWAGLRWDHRDIHEFITIKNWAPEVRNLKERDFNFPATLDGTNISVLLNDEFFEAYADDEHPKNALAHSVYWAVVKQMLQTAEPGFSVDMGENAGETLRNAPVTKGTHVSILEAGNPDEDVQVPVGAIIGKPVTIWTGEQYANNVVFRLTDPNAPVVKVGMTNGKFIRCSADHPFIIHEDRSEVRGRIRAVNLRLGQQIAVTDGVEPVFVASVAYDGTEDVYCCDVGLPEHSFEAEGVLISNCTEVTSADDSDICNLGSVNLSRVDSLEEMREIVECATAFLLAGTVYSDVPFSKIDTIRTKNRRLGLGLMGIHEWLLKRGRPYGPDEELGTWLAEYAKSTKIAKRWAKTWGISAPKKTRAIAPNGTIGIAAETTTSAEPVFCVAFKRRYLKHKIWNYQYVVDPTADRLIKAGVSPESIEDAYKLAENVERRVAFQAWLQQYVDHGISSTINLPAWGTEFNNEARVRPFGEMLLNYLPRLRGVTCYPDGARGGQPLVPVQYSTAIKHIGRVYEEGPAAAIREERAYEADVAEQLATEDHMTDAEAAMPIDACSILKPGSCG